MPLAAAAATARCHTQVTPWLSSLLMAAFPDETRVRWRLWEASVFPCHEDGSRVRRQNADTPHQRINDRDPRLPVAPQGRSELSAGDTHNRHQRAWTLLYSCGCLQRFAPGQGRCLTTWLGFASKDSTTLVEMALS